MTADILVTGGTGTIGRHVTPLLRGAGAPLRVLSRHRREPTDGIEYVTGDLLTGDGIDAAVAGVATVVHLAGGPNAKGDDEATRTLVQAASRAGTQHLVYISVVGADRVPLSYFRNKLAAEQVVADSGLPFTTLRAAQVHDLVLTAAQTMAKLPVIPVPRGLRFQPVDAGEVAVRLVELALGTPAGRVPDLAGPKTYEMAELIRGYLAARGSHRPMVPIRMPGKAGRAYRAGDNLSSDGVVEGARTWEDFLAGRVGQHADRARRETCS
jgi:uncharacterized protein YbjT (DUF2867 family)